VLRYMTSDEIGSAKVPEKATGVFHGLSAVFRRYWRGLVRGSGIGLTIGILPGAGADIAGWIAYGVSKRFSKEPEKFGSGHVEGIVESSSANSSALASAWIPTLVLGIPGDTTAAIVIGVLYVHGINPGPTVFLETPEIIYSIFILFFLANLALIPIGYLAIKSIKLTLRIRREILMTSIIMFSIVGAYAVDNSSFGILIMLVFGLLAFVMAQNEFPVTPVVLGIVLGRLIEESFMISMIKSNGDPSAFVTRPIAAVLAALTLMLWVMPLLRARRGPVKLT